MSKEVMVQKNAMTMTSREIAELVESRHDKVKQSIERLVERGVIQSPPLGNFKNINNVCGKEYLICKRDSYVIVAQLSPEFTAKLVDRWQELEEQIKAPVTAMELIAQTALAMVEFEKNLNTMRSEIIEIQAKIAATPDDYYTVAGYYSKLGLQIDSVEAGRVGKKAVKLSKDKGIQIGRASCRERV